MLKFVLLLTLSTSALADPRIEYACEKLSKLGRLGYELKSEFTHDEFVKRIIKIDNKLEQMALITGYQAKSEYEASELTKAKCMSWQGG